MLKVNTPYLLRLLSTPHIISECEIPKDASSAFLWLYTPAGLRAIASAFGALCDAQNADIDDNHDQNQKGMNEVLLALLFV